jgi:hypothetical protein
MGLLDFMRSPAYRDPVVGVLVRRGRYWRGTMRLGSTSGVPLLLAGPRTAPEESRLALARELGDRYAALRPAIGRALFEHYEPYADAAELDLPRLPRSEQVWGHVAPVRVRIEPLGGLETVEIAYRTDWDTEHTVGARFQGWALTELNGSVV